MKPPKGVTLVNAEYFKDYKYIFTFSNEKKSIVDFQLIISHGTSLLGYLDISKFKKINIDKKSGDIYWGCNWDMCFHIEAYYNEKEIIPIKKKGGRKPIADKKVLLRLYILQSVVDSHGGTEIAQEKCTKFLNETFFNIIFT